MPGEGVGILNVRILSEINGTEDLLSMINVVGNTLHGEFMEGRDTMAQAGWHSPNVL